MELKDVLVQVDATERSKLRVSLAAELAQRHGAHLSGIYVIEPQRQDSVAAVGMVSGTTALERASERSRAGAGEAEADFRQRLNRAGVMGEWRLVNGVPEQIIPLHARYSDLLVVGQSNPDDPLDFGTAIATRAVHVAGRPILTIPYAGRFDSLATNVVVAWNDTREAARALNDALPLLEGAGKVLILAVNPPGNEFADGGTGGAADIALHLARHGVKAEAARLEVREVSAGDAILNRAFDLGADLLVSGAYGHSQLREFVLGGVTRDLFDHMTVPVFMSH